MKGIAHEPHNNRDDEQLHAIGLRVGSEEYGLELKVIRQMIRTPRITRVPKAPPFVKGVINLHGNVIPVLDVALRFGIGETSIGPRSKVVVVESADETVGLLAESVSSVIRLSRSAMQPPPPLVAGIGAQYLEGVVRLADRFLVFLNLERTLADDVAPAHDTGDA